MGTSTHYGMTFPISPALSFEKTPRSQFLRSSATCAGCASRLRQELASSFLYVSSKQAASHGEDGCRGKPAPPTNVSGSSASVTFLALNWFAVLFGRTATSFRPSTKCAYRVESEALQVHPVAGKVRMKDAPRPALFWTTMLPPCASMILLQILRP